MIPLFDYEKYIEWEGKFKAADKTLLLGSLLFCFIGFIYLALLLYTTYRSGSSHLSMGWYG